MKLPTEDSGGGGNNSSNAREPIVISGLAGRYP